MPHSDLIVNGERWPSVTEVLDAEPKPWLIAWRKKKGKKYCDHILKTTSHIGSAFHKAIELSKCPKWKRIIGMYLSWWEWAQTEPPKYWLHEVKVKHNELKYHGTLDALNVLNLEIFDWKTKKKIDYINGPIQLKAYAMAYEAETGKHISIGRIVNVCREKPYILTEAKFDLDNPKYEKEWLRRLEYYYAH